MRLRKINFYLKSFAILLATGLLVSCDKDDDNSSNDTDEISVDNYALVATGQTTLYDNDGEVISSLSEGDALYGQDANYLKGASMSYQDNQNETITDLNTSLMWQQIPNSEGFTWDEAVEYCENLELGGYDDWRMPNIKELFSISDFTSGWPYIDTDYFTLASGSIEKNEQYWSSNKYVGTTAEGGANAAFGVNHVTGHIKAYPSGSDMPTDGGPTDGGPSDGNPPSGGSGDASSAPMSGNPLAKFVRAVRGGDYGVNDFTDNEDGTITDKSTGLMWTQADNGSGIDWEAALAFAENSTIANHSDWRLPNVKELQSIVDYSYAPGATDASNEGPAINPLFSCTQITSEAGYSDYAYYWTGTSANFTSGQPYYYAWYVAFGRAVNGEGEDLHGAGAVRFDTKHENGPAGEDAERYYNYVRLVRDSK